MTSDADREMHGGAGGGIGGPLPGEPKDPWEVRRQLVSAGVRIELPTGLREISQGPKKAITRALSLLKAPSSALRPQNEKSIKTLS